MPRFLQISFLLVLSLIFIACSPKTTTSTTAQEVQAPASQPTTPEKKIYNAEIVIIGANQEAIEVATSAAQNGSNSILLLANNQPVVENTLSSTYPQVTILPDGLAQGVLMTNDGAIRGLNGQDSGLPMSIECQSIVLALSPQLPEVASLVSFLSKDEEGNLLTDSKCQLLRQVNLSHAAPTKCGVPLTAAGTREELPPELGAITGFYALETALGTEAPLSPSELGKIVVAAQNLSEIPAISLSN